MTSSLRVSGRRGYEPVTLTTQVQLAGACTTNVCAPSMDWAVTDCPEAPVWLIAGVPVGDDPSGVTDTSNDGPPAGAGVQLKAQPMFQLAAVVVNAGLVQLPCICVGPNRTRAGPAAAVDGGVDVVVEPPAPVVVVVDPPAPVVVVVDPPAPVVVVEPLEPRADDDVVVVVDPVDVGTLYAGAFDAEVAPPPEE